MDTLEALIQAYPLCNLEKVRDIYQPGKNDAALIKELTNLFSADIPPIIKEVYYENEELNILLEQFSIRTVEENAVCKSRILGSKLNEVVIWELF